MGHIFLSYSRLDKDYVEKLISKLKDEQIEFWYDGYIELGADWEGTIENKIDTCDAFVIILTAASQKSKNVKNELLHAKDRGKNILPLLLEGEVWFSLKSTQCELVREGQLPSSNFFQKLAKRSLLKKTLEHFSIEWCYVPAGNISIGYKSSGVPAFSIAKHPVTNYQFQEFVDSVDGYRNKDYWTHSESSVRWRRENPMPLSAKFKGDLLPRENVNWYEAVAFCAWLSQKLGQSVRLPRDVERIRSVQTNDLRKYPWGNEFQVERCNTIENGLYRTTPVNQYPLGANPYGVFDLSGNVWEWSGTFHDNMPLAYGGGWRSRRRHATANHPRWHDPSYRAADLGFRVCILGE